MFRTNQSRTPFGYLLSFTLIICFACAGKTAGTEQKPKQGIDGLPSPKHLDKLTEELWAGYYIFGKKAGYVHFDVRKDGNVYRASSKARLKIRGLGDTREISVDEIRDYSAQDGRLVRAQMVMRGHEKREILLEERSGEYTVTETIGAEKKVTTIPPPGETLKGVAGAQIHIWEGNTAPGTSYERFSFRVVPPLYAKATKTKVLFESSEKRFLQGVEAVFHVVKQVEEELGLEMTAVYTSEGNLVRIDQGGGISVRVESESVAKSMAEAPDVLDLTLIRVDPPIRGVSALESIDLRITMQNFPPSFDTERIEILQKNGNQATIRIKRMPKTPGTTERTAPTVGLESTNLIQATAPEVISLAKELVSDAVSANDKVERLIKGVQSRVKKAYRPELASALDVIRTMEGDCTEHAVLFVALARSLGIPARVLVGLTHTSMMGGGFGGHAWAEVWLEGRWRPVDPAFGQTEADVGHIPFNVGTIDIRTMLALSASLRDIQIEVINKTQAK